MLIIVDVRAPEEAKENLKRYGEMVEFETSGITYDAISGHPDVFMCRVGEELVVAPNIAERFIETGNLKLEIRTGRLDVGREYPESARYNAVVTDDLIIHNLDISDPELLMMTWDRQQVHVPQGYSRCNLLPLKNNHFITSDKGIEKNLKEIATLLYVDSQEILLPGFEHGFFGGACGVFEDNVFVMGTLEKISQGKEIHSFLTNLNYEVIELYDGPLFDVGSILFI